MAAGLRSWQVPAKDKLVRAYRSGIQCMIQNSDTGTGKTLIAIQTAKELDIPLWVCCPKAVKSAWRYWATELNYTKLIDVVNPERLVLGRTPWWDGDRWNMDADALLVFDECHKGGGMDAKYTKALALTKAYKLKVLAQSATVANSPLQMRALGFLLGLHNFGKRSYFDWAGRSGCRYDGQKYIFPNDAKGVEAMRALHEKIKDRMVRLRIADIPEFPECETEVKLFDAEDCITSEINEAYQEALESVSKKVPFIEFKAAMIHARRRAEIAKVPLLLELANTAVEEGKSCVLFVNFRSTIELLKTTLRHPHIAIYGDGSSEQERTDAVARFQADEAVVAVVQSQAGGCGLSLQDLRRVRPRVSYLTPSFSASDMRQCLGRIHRVGGSKVVQTFVLIAGTIEEKVQKSITNKLACLDTLNDGDLWGIGNEEYRETT